MTEGEGEQRMKGWIIYDRCDAEKNGWFIEQISQNGRKYGIDFRLVLTEDFDENEMSDNLRLPEIAIVRSRHHEMSSLLEKKGVRCFNNSETCRIANDKWLTYLLCSENGLPVMKTALNEAVSEYPYVIKSLDGHGGSEVFWADGKEAEEKARGLIRGDVITQVPCSNPGKDMRVYVLGGEIAAAVLRTSDCDFRSNFSLGGNVVSAVPTEEQRNMVRRLHELLKFDYVGVDFIYDNGSWVINEIEDAVGARMLYSVSDIDICGEFAAYVARIAGAERINK